jgi:divalent metal cation (Fe/Co/Zn/Cd) transporter
MNDFVHVASRETDTRKGRRLEYFTLGWNLTEAVVGIGAGVIAGSIALVGFGVDSIIESFPVLACCGVCNLTRLTKGASSVLLSSSA